MSVPTPDKVCTTFYDLKPEYCSVCGDPMGVFTCHGCCQAFCVQHASKHREPLLGELEILRQKTQQLDTSINDDVIISQSENILQEITEWEKQSIAKIRKAADEARAKVKSMGGGHGHTQVKQLLDCRDVFANRLTQAAKLHDFHERHLEYWGQFLEDLKMNLYKLKTSYVRLEYCTMPFITKILVHESYFTTSFTKWCYYQRKCAQVIDIKRADGPIIIDAQPVMAPCPNSFIVDCNQQPVVSGASSSWHQTREAVGTGASSSWRDSQILGSTATTSYQQIVLNNTTVLHTGEYQFNITSALQFIGIISSNANGNRDSLNTRSVYGWTGDGSVYLNGVLERAYRGYRGDMEIGDTISLAVNCELRHIRLTNVTKNRTHELNIEDDKCPLPWLLKIQFAEQY